MATVTGYTAERMKQIEDTTVVDGNIVGNNLHLLQRNGTSIDAGNVRGPAGAQGVPGPVPSVNDQTGAVYAPRIFANKTTLDGWTTAPEGTLAVTSDLDVAWYKTGPDWNPYGAVRIFSNTTERNTRWVTPPPGALSITLDTNTIWQYIGTAWKSLNDVTKPWNTAWGRLQIDYPPPQIGFTTAMILPGTTLTINYTAGRLIKATFSAQTAGALNATLKLWIQNSTTVFEDDAAYIRTDGFAGRQTISHTFNSENNVCAAGASADQPCNIDRMTMTTEDIGPVTRTA